MENIIEKGYLYKLNYVRDVENWVLEYCYLVANTYEEANELAHEIIHGDDQCIIDIHQIPHEEKENIYAVFTYKE